MRFLRTCHALSARCGRGEQVVLGIRVITHPTCCRPGPNRGGSFIQPVSGPASRLLLPCVGGRGACAPPKKQRAPSSAPQTRLVVALSSLRRAGDPAGL